MTNPISKKIILTILTLIVAVISFFGLSKITTNTESPFIRSSIEQLEEDKQSVLLLTSGSTTASIAVSALPGDTATPVAEKLADISGYFIIVICAIYLEKFLLVISGLAAFKVIVPIACLLFLIGIWRNNSRNKLNALRTAVFALAIVALVPVSMGITKIVKDTYHISYDELMEEVDEVDGKAQEISEEIASTEAVMETQPAEEKEEEKKGFFHSVKDNVVDFIADATNKATDAANNMMETVTNKVNVSVKETVDMGKNLINKFIDALAIMIITSCVIPILVLVFFLWIIKLLLGVDNGINLSNINPKFLKGKDEE